MITERNRVLLEANSHGLEPRTSLPVLGLSVWPFPDFYPKRSKNVSLNNSFKCGNTCLMQSLSRAWFQTCASACRRDVQVGEAAQTGNVSGLIGMFQMLLLHNWCQYVSLKWDYDENMFHGKPEHIFWCYTHILHRRGVMWPKFNIWKIDSVNITEQKERWAKRFHIYITRWVRWWRLFITSIPLKHGFIFRFPFL